MSGLFKLVRNKFSIPADPQVSFAGKTILVTGANVGLGLEAAKKYAALGSERLILGVRTLSKGENAKEQILSAITREDGSKPDILVWPLDMNSFVSVKQFVERVNAELSTLDVALLNAGVIQPTYIASPDGWEEMLQVNTLSTILLGLLLLPKLRESSEHGQHPSYLSFVSSSTHTTVDISHVQASYSSGSILTYLNSSAHFPGRSQYGNTKLLLEYAKTSMANLPLVRSPGSSVCVIVNSCCPGLCQTDIGHNVTQNSWLMSMAAWMMFQLFARTSEQGSRTLVSSTTLGAESHGKWWRDDVFHAE